MPARLFYIKELKLKHKVQNSHVAAGTKTRLLPALQLQYGTECQATLHSGVGTHEVGATHSLQPFPELAGILRTLVFESEPRHTFSRHERQLSVGEAFL